MSSLVQKQLEQPIYEPKRGTKNRKDKAFKSRISKGEKFIYTISLAAVIFVIYLLLSNYASIYIANHEIQQNERAIQEQMKVNEGLSLQVMELSDPERILSMAKDMGMVLDENNVKFTHTNN